MKRIAMIWLAVLVLTTVVMEQIAHSCETGGKPWVAQAKGAPASVDRILEEYVKAIGGRAAIERVKTRVIKASFVLNDGTLGTLAVYAKTPNKRMATVFDPDGHLISEYGFDGSVGWDQSSVSERGFYAVSGQL